MDSGARCKVVGKMAVIAFLHERATVREAAEAVKVDLIRSIRGRIQLHCDSLENTPDKGEPDFPTLHEPPRRILIRLPGSEVSISDYLYPGEHPEDSRESVEEIFGFRPGVEFMDDELELMATPKENIMVREKTLPPFSVE